MKNMRIRTKRKLINVDNLHKLHFEKRNKPRSGQTLYNLVNFIQSIIVDEEENRFNIVSKNPKLIIESLMELDGLFDVDIEFISELQCIVKIDNRIVNVRIYPDTLSNRRGLSEEVTYYIS